MRHNQSKSQKAWVAILAFCLLVFIALAGANLLISDINSDELSNMGIEKKS